ncbi:MAG TPA: hypothetical protein VGM72_03755 [Micropepsaceae bacterium]|jgi:hypothetical protein
MTARPPKEELALEMPFAEAMERFAGVIPAEMHANIAKSKKKKPPSGKKKRKPPGGKAKNQNVVSLRERKNSLRRKGLA